jgi:hypothetical protein
MKRIFILFIIINNSYGMQQSVLVAASPRTDEAAKSHKLRLLIANTDLEKLLASLPTIKERLKDTKKTIYYGNNNLQITFILAGLKAEVCKTNGLGKPDTQYSSYSGSIDEFQRLLYAIHTRSQQID